MSLRSLLLAAHSFRNVGFGPRTLACKECLRPPRRAMSSSTSREIVKEKQLQMEQKYGDKLRRRMAEEGVEDLGALKARVVPRGEPGLSSPSAGRRRDDQTAPVAKADSRVDSSPLKPLSDILDLELIHSQPHSRDIIHSLWTTYHSSRDTHGGPALLSATMTCAVYLDMLQSAQKYPVFVLPLPRTADDGSKAWEFYLLEWAFFDPPAPSRSLFDTLEPYQAKHSQSHPYSTVLFTPLVEYKLHESFARPYLVLSHYTDLAASHDLVLLRGDITRSPTNSDRLLLSQADAHMLAMGLQRFYLAQTPTDDKTATERKQLLKDFHEKQDEFKWERLLQVAWEV